MLCGFRGKVRNMMRKLDRDMLHGLLRWAVAVVAVTEAAARL